MIRLLAVFLLAALPAAAQETSARELFRSLNSLRVDREQIYFVREVHLRREAARLSFTEGKLALLTAHNGQVTGAVFSGLGRVVASPRDPVEKSSLARYLGVPLLDLEFTRAYLRFTDTTAQDLLAQLRDAGVKPAPDAAFAEDWNLTVANLNPWHSLRIANDRLSAQPQPYFYAALVTANRGAIDVLYDPRREESVLIGQPQLAQGRAAYEVWASYRAGEAEEFVPPFAPVSYAVESTIRPDASLAGTAELRLRAPRDGERVVPLQLSRQLTVQSAVDGQGRPLEFFQLDETSRGPVGLQGDETLFVVLAAPARAGQELALRLTYQGRVIEDAGNKVYFVGSRGSWYPRIASLAHFVTFDLTFRWPTGLRLAATGKRVEEREEGEWQVGRWISERPVPVAGFNLGEYVQGTIDGGAYRVDLYANKQLEQALVQRFQRGAGGATVVTGLRPRATPAPPTSGSSTPAVTGTVLPPVPPPSPSLLLEELGKSIVDSIQFYEKFSGPFPFDRLAVSPIPGGFGQGWPGLLYLSTLSFLPAEAHERAGLSERTQGLFIDLLPYHEVAHQWWGSTVGSRSYRDEWIHEGLASYLALLYAHSKQTDEKAMRTWLDRFRKDLVTKPSGRQEDGDALGPLVLGHRLAQTAFSDRYQRVVYGKGPWVFHMLRMMLRDPATKDPDARFVSLLRSLAETWRHRGLSTADLKRALEERMTKAMDVEGDRKMDWFFDQWVYGTGIPRYKVEFEVKPQGQSFVVSGKLLQTEVPDWFVAAVPLYLPGSGERVTPLGVVYTEGPETFFQFTTRVRPSRILIDPEMTLLCIPE